MNDKAVREDEVFEAVRALVERGEYLDQIPGLPGVALTGGGVIMGVRRGRAATLWTRLAPIPGRARGGPRRTAAGIAMRVRSYESAIASRFVFLRKIGRPAACDFCSKIIPRADIRSCTSAPPLWANCRPRFQGLGRLRVLYCN